MECIALTIIDDHGLIYSDDFTGWEYREDEIERRRRFRIQQEFEKRIVAEVKRRHEEPNDLEQVYFVTHFFVCVSVCVCKCEVRVFGVVIWVCIVVVLWAHMVISYIFCYEYNSFDAGGGGGDIGQVEDALFYIVDTICRRDAKQKWLIEQERQRKERALWHPLTRYVRGVIPVMCAHIQPYEHVGLVFSVI